MPDEVKRLTDAETEAERGRDDTRLLEKILAVTCSCGDVFLAGWYSEDVVEIRELLDDRRAAIEKETQG